MFIAKVDNFSFFLLFFSGAAVSDAAFRTVLARRPAEKQKRRLGVTVYYKHGTPPGFEDVVAGLLQWSLSFGFRVFVAVSGPGSLPVSPSLK